MKNKQRMSQRMFTAGTVGCMAGFILGAKASMWWILLVFAGLLLCLWALLMDPECTDGKKD